MMVPTGDDIEALIEEEQQKRLAKEAAEDESSKRGGGGASTDRYRAEREENDKRRSRKSGDGDAALPLRPGSSDGSANGSDPRRRAHDRNHHRRSREPRDDEADSGEPMMLDSAHSPQNAHDGPPRRADRSDRGDYYSGGGRPQRDADDTYRPRSSGSDRSRHRRRSPSPRRDRRGGRSRSPRRDRRDETRYRSPRRDHRDSRRRPPPPPEPTDDERDRRTVFVQQLAQRARTSHLKDFFEAAGEVIEAQVVKDRVSGRSKGVGYVEFKDEESVEKAIGFTGQKLCGIPVIVQLTEAEKNRQARNAEGGATQSNGVPFHRLYVGNIHFAVGEQDLKEVFEPFGELEFVQLQKEEHTGRSKGYGFVQYHDPAHAKEALEKMNGFEIASRAIRVGLGNDKFTDQSTKEMLKNNQFTGSAFSGSGGRGAHAGGSANFDRASGRDAEKAGGASALDDTDVGGVNFSNYSRDSLMRKLARTEDPEPKVQPKAPQQKKAPVAQTPASRCVLLKHMYNQAEETEPNWQKELEEDVRTECNEKYGKVVHIGLSLDNNDGEVYIKFDRVQGGENAIRGLNGRFFGGRMISADYVIEAMYNANFPKAKNV